MLKALRNTQKFDKNYRANDIIFEGVDMLKLLTFFGLLSLLNGCVTSSTQSTGRSNPEAEVKRPSQAQFIEKNHRSLSIAEKKSDCGSVNAKTFYLTHLTPGTPFSKLEQCKFGKLTKNPQLGSLEQAALVIGLVKLSLVPKSSASFISTPEDSENREDDSSKPLEELTSKSQVDLVQAIQVNPFLRSFTVFALINQSLNQRPNSEDFTNLIKQTLAQQSEGWQTLGLVTPKSENIVNESDSPNMKTATPEESIAKVRYGDSVLLEAQTLADSRNFYEAINKAASVDKNNPLYPSAQEKISHFSNQAVQELRQKAALAFQSAIPLSDPKVRSAYLEEAKKHLEEALNNFPKAPEDQLSTVRENLLVITKNLEQIPDSE